MPATFKATCHEREREAGTAAHLVIPAKAGIQAVMSARIPTLRHGSVAKNGRGDNRPAPQGPLVWTFDGGFASSLADLEDTFRRALVQIGDVSRIAVMIEVSLPALKLRLEAGEAVQPAWTRFVDSVTARYGLPNPPRIRYLKTRAPLATLVIAYRS